MGLITAGVLLGGAALGAGASALASGGSKVKAPPAQEPADLGRQSLQAQIDLAPQVYQTEAQYRPLYAALDANILNTTLFGGTQTKPQQWSMDAYLQANPQVRADWQAATATRDARGRTIKPQTTLGIEDFARQHWERNGRQGGMVGGETVTTPGLLDTIGRTNTIIGQQTIDANRTQRAADIADVAALGGQAQAAFKAANPQLTSLMDRLTGNAMKVGQPAAAANGIVGPLQSPAGGPMQAPVLTAPTATAAQIGPQQQLQAGTLNPLQQVQAPTANATTVGPLEQLRAGALDPVQQLQAGTLNPVQQLQAGTLNPVQQVQAGTLNPLQQLQAPTVSTNTGSDLLGIFNRQAADDLNLGSALSPAQERMAQQSVRSAFGARGLNASMPSAFAEGLAALDYGRGLQNERRQFAMGVEGANRAAVGQTLQRDLANASNALDAGRFNIQTGLQANQFDLANALDAGRFNAQLGLQANQFDLANALDAGRFNIQTGLQANQFDLANALDAGRFNIQTGLQANQFDVANQLDAGRFNLANALQTNLANASAQNAMSQFNAGNQLDASRTNAQLGLQANQFDVANQLDAGRFNLANALQAEQANVAAQNAMAQFNLGNALDTARFNAGNNLETQRFNLGYNMQQAESDRAYQMSVAQMLAAQAQDPFQMVLGRSAVPSSGMALAQGNLGRVSAPQMFNPWDASIMGIYSGNQANQLAAATATANNRAAMMGSMMGMFGSLGGGALAGAGAAACWVAREVLGTTDGRWLKFRAWLLERAPERRRARYLAYGPEIARWLSTRPDWSARIRRWMEGILAADHLNTLKPA